VRALARLQSSLHLHSVPTNDLAAVVGTAYKIDCHECSDVVSVPSAKVAVMIVQIADYAIAVPT
jgi:hypothetical protein